jgi:hypothetical protein
MLAELVPAIAGALGPRDLVRCALELFGRAAMAFPVAVAAAPPARTAAAASALNDPLLIEALGLIAGVLPLSFEPFVTLALPHLLAIVDDSSDRRACDAAIVRLGQFVGAIPLATAGIRLLEIAAAHAGTVFACQAVGVRSRTSSSHCSRAWRAVTRTGLRLV